MAGVGLARFGLAGGVRDGGGVLDDKLGREGDLVLGDDGSEGFVRRESEGGERLVDFIVGGAAPARGGVAVVAGEAGEGNRARSIGVPSGAGKLVGTGGGSGGVSDDKVGGEVARGDGIESSAVASLGEGESFSVGAGVGGGVLAPAEGGVAGFGGESGESNVAGGGAVFEGAGDRGGGSLGGGGVLDGEVGRDDDL